MITWGFDLDEIICDFVGPLIEETNRHFGINLQFKDLEEYYLHSVLGMTEEETRPVFDILCRPEKMMQLPLLSEGYNILRELKRRNCKIVIITARGPRISDTTRLWLEQHNVPYDELFFTNHEAKGPFAKEANVSCFVEDHPLHANSVAKEGIKVFTPILPWNKNREMHSNIRMVKNCSEILNFVGPDGSFKEF